MKQNNNIPPGYKDSPLGVIPEEWEVKEFNEFAQLSKAKYIPSETETVKCLELEHIEQGTGNILGWINSSSQKSTKNRFKKGEVLFGKLRPYLQKYWLTQFDGVCSSEIWVLNSIKKECTNDFLFKLIQTNHFIQVANVSSGSKMPRADWDYVSSYPFLLPPLPEQQKIAEILSVWDETIEKQTRLIAQLETRKRGLMQQLLTGKKRLKGFKEKWEEKPLDETVNFYNGKAHENNIDEDGKFILVNSKFISTEGLITKRTNSCLFPLFQEDIVMVMSDVPNGRAIAKCYYIEEDNKYTLNQRICVLKTKNEYASKFLFYTLNRNKYYLLYDDGVKQTNLRKEEVLECPVYVPKYREQIAIANILSTADNEINLTKQKLSTLKEQKKGLMQQLLTGKKRVKIKQ